MTLWLGQLLTSCQPCQPRKTHDPRGGQHHVNMAGEPLKKTSSQRRELSGWGPAKSPSPGPAAPAARAV